MGTWCLIGYGGPASACSWPLLWHSPAGVCLWLSFSCNCLLPCFYLLPVLQLAHHVRDRCAASSTGGLYSCGSARIAGLDASSGDITRPGSQCLVRHGQCHQKP